MLKKIKSRIWIKRFVLKFEYDTKRGNHKEQEREIFQLDEESAKRDFHIWINTMKEQEPHRAMLNVNILSVVEDGGKLIEL